MAVRDTLCALSPQQLLRVSTVPALPTLSSLPSPPRSLVGISPDVGASVTHFLPVVVMGASLCPQPLLSASKPPNLDAPGFTAPRGSPTPHTPGTSLKTE